MIRPDDLRVSDGDLPVDDLVLSIGQKPLHGRIVVKVSPAALKKYWLSLRALIVRDMLCFSGASHTLRVNIT